MKRSGQKYSRRSITYRALNASSVYFCVVPRCMLAFNRSPRRTSHRVSVITCGQQIQPALHLLCGHDALQAKDIGSMQQYGNSYSSPSDKCYKLHIYRCIPFDAIR
eukprot:6180839-Pleurochrysis_carterae.AAC.1